MINGKWSYPLNQNGPIQGFNDQGIEYFLGNPIESLAKEIIQNSIDAGLNNETKPVRVVFQKFILETKNIPDINTLKDFYKAGIISWKKDEIVREFCLNALEMLDGPSIECLRVSDFNTKGITGSQIQEQTSAWFNLTKGSGSTEKVGTAGGSKGIGKNAAFANSALRLVYFSTKDIDYIEATQGLLKMVSLKGYSTTSLSEQTLGPIYFGNKEAHSPLNQYYSLDKEFNRNSDETGSDIFIIGFRQKNSNWENKIIEKTLINFMYAIHTGRLEVNVQGYNLSKENYLTYIEENIEKKGLKDVISMSKVLNSDKTLSILHQIEDKGGFEVKVLKMNEMEASKKCWYIRKPWMMITTLKSSYLPVLPFTALVLIHGDKLNEFLRKLESAKHDAWEIERAGNEEKISIAESILRTMREKIIETIKSAFNFESGKAITPVGDEITINNGSEETQESVEVINSKNPVIDFQKSRTLKTPSKKVNPDETLIYNPETGKLEPSDNGSFKGTEVDKNKKGKQGLGGKRGLLPGNQNELIDGENKYNLYAGKDQIDARLVVHDFKEKIYKVVFKLEKEETKLSLKFNEVDSEGNKFDLYIIKATSKNTNLRIKDNYVFLDSPTQKGLVELFIKVRNRNYFTSEVLFYGIKK